MGWVMACKQRARGPGWRRGRSIVAPYVHVVVVCVVGTERERGTRHAISRAGVLLNVRLTLADWYFTSVLPFSREVWIASPLQSS